MRRLLSPAFFALVVVMFFLPFVAVSCNVGPLAGAIPDVGPEGEQIPELPPDGRITIFEATGYELITDDIEPSDELRQFEDLAEETGEAPVQEESSTPHGRIWLVLAAIVAVAGIVLSLLGGRLGATLAVGLGVLGAALLGIFTMAFRSGLDQELAEGAEAPGFQASQFLEIRYQYGFWLALMFFLAAAAAGVWGLVADRPAAPTGVPVGDRSPDEPMAPPASQAGDPVRESPPPAEPETMPEEPPPPPEAAPPPEEPDAPPREERGPPPA